MAVKPEIEVIDQLCGGELPLALLAGFFETEEKAKVVFSIYLKKNIVQFLEAGIPIPQWKAEKLIRECQGLSEQNNIKVSLTDDGAKKFNAEDWSKI